MHSLIRFFFTRKFFVTWWTNEAKICVYMLTFGISKYIVKENHTEARVSQLY